MFEPEDSDLDNIERPTAAGFFAVIVNKVIDENFASSITMTTHLKNAGKY